MFELPDIEKFDVVIIAESPDSIISLPLPAKEDKAPKDVTLLYMYAVLLPEMLLPGLHEHAAPVWLTVLHTLVLSFHAPATRL